MGKYLHADRRQYTVVPRNFIINASLPSRREIPFASIRSSGAEALAKPRAPASEREPGDVYTHSYMGGIQRWVCNKKHKWSAAKVGDIHPVLGKTRVLSHHAPFEDKHPTWVLPESLTKAASRKNRR